jgi:hypothetical protein
MIGTRSLFHPVSAQDTAAMVAMRAIVEPNKGRLQGMGNPRYLRQHHGACGSAFGGDLRN